MSGYQQPRLRNIITTITITIRIIIPTAMATIHTAMGMAIPTTATAGVEGFSAVLGVNTMSVASMAGSVGMAGSVTATEVDSMVVAADSMAAAVDFTGAVDPMVVVADFMEEVEAADTDNSL